MKTIKEGQAKEILTAIFKNKEFTICEYETDTETFFIYDEKMNVRRKIPNYLDYLEHGSLVEPQDRDKLRELYLGETGEQTEIRVKRGEETTRMLVQLLRLGGERENGRNLFLVKDITKEKNRERLLEEQAARDSLTSLYNDHSGRKLINEYLQNKAPYATCGMMVIDIDYFKYVNDTFGHLFGDYVLVELAQLLRNFFAPKDVIMRFGGDEFVILLKDISHSALVKKGMELVNAVRKMRFGGKDYSMTCSVGICYLPENESGYTYDQMFENADWALYQAKENGKDQYAFCDNLRRF